MPYTCSVQISCLNNHDNNAHAIEKTNMMIGYKMESVENGDFKSMVGADELIIFVLSYLLLKL